MYPRLAFLLLNLAAIYPEKGQVDFRPGPAESAVPERFRMEPAAFAYELETVLTTRRYRVAKLRFPSPIKTPDAENNVVHAEYFEPIVSGPKRPGVVVLHILGADFPLSRYMAARLADRQVAALFVKLPYYGERRPLEVGTATKRFLSTDIERTMRSMRQAVHDVRRAACWLAARPAVESRRIGVAGISLGGIVAALAAAIDPGIKQGAFLLAGGDLSKILWEIPESAPYRAAWIAAGRTRADLKALTDPFDPLTYADRLLGKRLLFIAGKVDEVVSPASTLVLWEAAGRPSIRWYDCGHYSAVGYLLPGIRQTVDFFASP
jgi:dienelactone hydrolase